MTSPLCSQKGRMRSALCSTKGGGVAQVRLPERTGTSMVTANRCWHKPSLPMPTAPQRASFRRPTPGDTPPMAPSDWVRFSKARCTMHCKKRPFEVGRLLHSTTIHGETPCKFPSKAPSAMHNRVAFLPGPRPITMPISNSWRRLGSPLDTSLRYNRNVLTNPVRVFLSTIWGRTWPVCPGLPSKGSHPAPRSTCDMPKLPIPTCPNIKQTWAW